MKGAGVFSFLLMLAACATPPKTELPHSPDLPTATLIYTPNYGEVLLQRVNLMERRTLPFSEALPAISDDDIRLMRFDSNPLLQNESLNQTQAELDWNVAPNSEIVFAQKRLPPGDYAIVSYKERNSTLAYAMYGTICFREAAPVLRFNAGSLYYMDSIITLTEREGTQQTARGSAKLLQALLSQKPVIEGDVDPVELVEVVSFDPPNGIFQSDCAIGKTFSAVAVD